MNHFEAIAARAVESNANKATKIVKSTKARFEAEPIPKGDLTAWMNDMQEDAEVDLVRYEMSHKGQDSNYLDNL